MTETPYLPDTRRNQFPLSCPQELWCSGDMGDEEGFFSASFVITSALRITGRIDVPALQGALDDVVERHELLRTVIVRDARPPYQRVDPPCAVPLEVRDVPPVTGRSRDVAAEELLIEAAQVSVLPRTAPLLRALLHRFDDEDAVLVLIAHHSACDGWSMQLIMRDLAACYAARNTGRPARLPHARQYREFAASQQERLKGPSTARAHEYWREKLDGARVFAAPTDRMVPDRHTRPYSAANLAIEADVLTASAALAQSTRSSTFMVLLAALNVLAHQINGTIDPVIDTLTDGHDEAEFQDTVGPFLNFLALRTNIGTCASFREIVARTRETWLGGFAHEIPIQHVEEALPDLMAPNDEPMVTNFIVGMSEPRFDGATLRIAGGSQEIRKRVLQEPAGLDIPHGIAWNMDIQATGELWLNLQYNREDLDESTALGWLSAYRRILSQGVDDPDQDWKKIQAQESNRR